MVIKTITYMLMFVMGLSLTSCISSRPHIPESGFVTHYKSTFDVADHKPFTKKGVSSSYSYFMIVASGDASIVSAMKNGDIHDVSHVDKEYIKVNALFFLEGITIYEEYTTIVYGN